MKAQKKEPPRAGTRSGSVQGLASENDCKIIITQYSRKAQAQFSGEEALDVSWTELVLCTIGIGWSVGRLFRLVDYIDGRKGLRKDA
jgi:hypothetical protein